MTIAAGTKLGRDEIRSMIGAGGMGEVLRGRLISPDDQWIIVSNNQRQSFTFAVGSGEQRPIPWDGSRGSTGSVER